MVEKNKTPKAAVSGTSENQAPAKAAVTAKAKATSVAKATAVVKAAPAKQVKSTAAKVAKPAKPVKTVKTGKQKMIRDSFTLPENDYANLSMLKSKCLENGVEVKKSELVRAGLIALTKMSMTTLVKAVGEVEKLKTGRPKSN